MTLRVACCLVTVLLLPVALEAHDGSHPRIHRLLLKVDGAHLATSWLLEPGEACVRERRAYDTDSDGRLDPVEVQRALDDLQRRNLERLQVEWNGQGLSPVPVRRDALGLAGPVDNDAGLSVSFQFRLELPGLANGGELRLRDAAEQPGTDIPVFVQVGRGLRLVKSNGEIQSHPRRAAVSGALLPGACLWLVVAPPSAQPVP